MQSYVVVQLCHSSFSDLGLCSCMFADFEIDRQIKELSAGREIVNMTMAFDAVKR